MKISVELSRKKNSGTGHIISRNNIWLLFGPLVEKRACKLLEIRLFTILMDIHQRFSGCEFRVVERELVSVFLEIFGLVSQEICDEIPLFHTRISLFLNSRYG